jgi:hypothetical protein
VREAVEILRLALELFYPTPKDKVALVSGTPPLSLYFACGCPIRPGLCSSLPRARVQLISLVGSEDNKRAQLLAPALLDK